MQENIADYMKIQVMETIQNFDSMIYRSNKSN